MGEQMTFAIAARTRHLSLALISTAFILSAGAAFAAGGGSGGDDGDANKKGDKGKPITDMTTCPKGQVWNVKKKECAKEKADALPDDDMANYAWVLAKAGRYDEALDALNLLHDPNTAKALNYRGFATRKLGRTDEGIGYYLKSVQTDPHYAQVREYLGEAYVIKGRVDLAKDQLSTIKDICGGTDCEEYEDLSAAIKGAT
jgi:tetratricopeptide (TPR) repeat protein